MKNNIAIILLGGGLWACSGPTPGPGGLPYVKHNDSLAGSGTTPTPLVVNLMPDGGLEYLPDAGIRVSPGLAGLFNGNGGSLAVSQSSFGNFTVNLTSVGTTDWMAPENGLSFINRKITGSGALHQPIFVAAGHGSAILNVGSCGNPCTDGSSGSTSISWTASDATTSRASPGNANPQYQGTYGLSGVSTTNAGLMTVVDALPHQQVLRMYIDYSSGCSTSCMTFQCTGTLTDGSGTVSTSPLTPPAAENFNVVTWTFTGSNIDTQLIVYCWMSGPGDSFHNAGLPWLAMALSPT
jgi:hypothetical protein